MSCRVGAWVDTRGDLRKLQRKGFPADPAKALVTTLIRCRADFLFS
jgi:hypothetical protein